MSRLQICLFLVCAASIFKERAEVNLFYCRNNKLLQHQVHVRLTRVKFFMSTLKYFCCWSKSQFFFYHEQSFFWSNLQGWKIIIGDIELKFLLQIFLHFVTFGSLILFLIRTRLQFFYSTLMSRASCAPPHFNQRKRKKKLLYIFMQCDV